MAKFGGKFDSNKQEWETPQWLFDCLDEEFEFTCDVAADETNAKVAHYISEEQDALSISWMGACWMNSPYKQVGKWVKKAHAEMLKGVTTVALVPARTNTNWWHDYCMKAKEIRFIKGRPKFGNAKYGLPQPLAIIIFQSPSNLFVGSDYKNVKISTFEIPDKEK